MISSENWSNIEEQRQRQRQREGNGLRTAARMMAWAWAQQCQSDLLPQQKRSWNKLCIEALPFWIPPSRPRYWEMVGSQFTMFPWMGLSQTTKNDNGNGSHSRFPGFVTIPCMGSWWTGTPPPLQGGRLVPTITDITERVLLYLAVHNSQKTYI